MRRLIKSLLLIALMIWIAGCDTTNNLQPIKIVKPQIDPNLPVIEASSIKFIPSITQIALEWKGTTADGTYGYYIYRSNVQKDAGEFTRVATVRSKYASHYVDTDLKPSTLYGYSISVIGKGKSESTHSQAVQVYTLPIIDSVSFITAVKNLPRQVKIIWRPHTNLSVNRYYLERSDTKHPKWEKIATIKGRLSPEYIDRDLKDNTTYSYRLRAVTFDNIVSEPSKIVKATTKKLPKGVNNVEATTNQAKKIIITWEPNLDKEIVGYNIYSSDSENGSYSKIAYANKDDNTVENIIQEDNKVKFYKITSVDKDGLETDIKTVQSVMGRTLSAPKEPILTLAMIQDQKVVLNWEKGDNRAVSYNIYKKASEGFFKSTTKVIKNIQDLRYEDQDISRGITYTYYIQAVDENGLVSNKVETTSLVLNKNIQNKTK